jgi:hypothetical protein
MDWVDRAVRVQRAKEGRDRLHELMMATYREYRESGFDHEETVAMMRGTIAVGKPEIWPLVYLWIEREAGK